jgi:hypothetical protein
MHVDLVAGLLADQRARDRRRNRDPSCLDVGFVVTDDLVGHRVAALLLEIDGGAEHAAPVGVEQLRVDDLRVAELGLDFRDATLDEALLVARRIVLGVLREIAVRARLRDGLGIGRPLDGLQAVQFGAQRFGTAGRHGGFGHQGMDPTVRERGVDPSFACRSCKR